MDGARLARHSLLPSNEAGAVPGADGDILLSAPKGGAEGRFAGKQNVPLGLLQEDTR